MLSHKETRSWRSYSTNTLETLLSTATCKCLQRRSVLHIWICPPLHCPVNFFLLIVYDFCRLWRCAISGQQAQQRLFVHLASSSCLPLQAKRVGREVVVEIYLVRLDELFCYLKVAKSYCMYILYIVYWIERAKFANWKLINIRPLVVLGMHEPHPLNMWCGKLTIQKDNG